MGASNRRGLLDAKLELLLGCALPPRHAEGASSSLRQALSAAPRDKLLAYALHFAQQYGTAGEAGTGVALLEAYTQEYTQQYGLKAVDRRLVTLRPQLLEAHLESLSREARPPPRPHPEDLADPLPEPTERLEQQQPRVDVLVFPGVAIFAAIGRYAAIAAHHPAPPSMPSTRPLPPRAVCCNYDRGVVRRLHSHSRAPRGA